MVERDNRVDLNMMRISLGVMKQFIITDRHRILSTAQALAYITMF